MAQTSKHSLSHAQARRQRTRQLISEAQSFELQDSYDVVVLGGGAAGLVAAIIAARAKARVLVVEQALEAGRSILATGGGRCNIAPALLVADAYNNPAFVEACMDELSWNGDYNDVISSFFYDAGLALSYEQDRVYPASMQASSVRTILLESARRAGVNIATGRTIEHVKTQEEPLELAIRDVFEQEERTALGAPVPHAGETDLHEVSALHRITASTLILAHGGAGTLPEGLSIDCTEMHPGLCGIAATGLPFDELDGRRAHTKLSLMRADKCIYEEVGELLFRSYGLSGIVSFNLSRKAQAHDEIIIEFAPEMSEQQYKSYVGRAQSAAGVIDPAIEQTLVNLQGLAPENTKKLHVKVLGPADVEHAQITLGGLSCAKFDPKSLAYKQDKRIFAAGEILDIDGPCGGYNLSWAWTSGMVAGRSAARLALAQSGA